jgi:hypothetical protein
MRQLALVALLTAFAPCGNAQRTGLPIAHHHPIRGGSSAIFFADPFYSDALYHEGSLAPSQPSVIILQPAPAAAPIAVPPVPPAQPLMIELQGGRYVRVSGEESSTAEMKRIDSGTTNPTPAKTHLNKAITSEPLSPAAHDPAPTILVFRDGHREEVSDYTIADGNLYTHADYYTAGSWNKKIALSSLNLPDTTNTNQSRGIKFQLPTAPNEVIIRP